MKNFNQNDKRGQMHRAVCSDCGKECEVPFRPSGERPVYCQVCFEKHGKVNPARSEGKNFGRSGFDHKPKFKAVCTKCGKKCEVPFQPSGDKPVYCQECFSQSAKDSAAGNKGRGAQSAKDHFEIINAKLDQILKALNSADFAVAGQKKTAVAKIAKPAKKAKSAAKKTAKKKK